MGQGMDRAEGRGFREWEVTTDGYSVSFRGDKNVLKFECSDGYIAL